MSGGESPAGKAGSLTKNFAGGSEGYYEARADEAPDMGNYFKAATQSGSHADFILYQAEASGQDSSILSADARATASHAAARRAKEKGQEDNVRLSVHLAMLNSLRDHITHLDYEIQTLEQQLIEQYGENFAEEAYIDLFGEPDPGMSRDDYLNAIASTILDEDGNVRPEYADHHLAQLLEMRHDRMEAREALNEYERTGNIEPVREVAREQGFAAADELAQQDDIQVGQVAEQEQERRIAESAAEAEPQNQHSAANFDSLFKMS